MAEEKRSALAFLTDNAVVTALGDAYNSFSEKRASLGLSNPGTVENIAREVQKDVFLNNFTFTGLRADLTKAFSVSPLFQVSHAFAMGSQGLPPYTFAAMYGTPKVFLQGNMDNDGQLSARANYRWNSSFVTKTNAQIAGPGQAMIQIDNDYTGNDFTASIKSLNPSLIEGGITGIFIGSYLQSITPRLALGLEAIWQRPSLSMGPETALSYCGKYRGDNWIASAQLQAQGAVNTSYWRRLTEKVEAGVDLNLQFAGLGRGAAGLMGGAGREGVTTLGAKYDFRASTFRAQVDSSGKLSCLLEKRIAPPVQLTFAGEIDHFKQQAKVGLAVSIEAAGEDLLEQQEKALSSPAPPPPF
ncbi:mitochondrial import receptor subunit TOM40 [Xylona heveae TC161]|uniref:Translocase of outer membrane 40 kDa subunit n=1 Tax=Xylona heveae (strain CBS 132557 / TC161) TaxID=1328760 RepID=A0A165FR78_XYLHT|nr:mitochondrial import receptor subunit TOM40 [Xylona heveae TC161]KZF21281.1 mitochondrial import receptor subunit TOM40 [Xylona heveae TC161]